MIAQKPVLEFLEWRTRFGRLAFVAESEPRLGREGRRLRRALCRCDCGGHVEVDLRNLKRGFTQSCGCWWPPRAWRSRGDEPRIIVGGRTVAEIAAETGLTRSAIYRRLQLGADLYLPPRRAGKLTAVTAPAPQA